MPKNVQVQFSCTVVSDTLWPHELKHARLPCPSPAPEAFTNSSPSSQWWHPPAVPFSSRLQSFPASGSFPICQLFSPGGQSIGVSALTSVLPMNIQGWFPLGLTGLISLSPSNSQESFPEPQFKSINSSALSLLYGPAFTPIHDYWKSNMFDIANCVTLSKCLKIFKLRFSPLWKGVVTVHMQKIIVCFKLDNTCKLLSTVNTHGRYSAAVTLVYYCC